MKYLNSIFTALLFATLILAGSTKVQAQTPTTQFKAIAGAIKAGDADALAKYFNSSLEVTLPGVDKTFSAKQATFVLKDFFTTQGVKSFQMLHTGSSGATNYMTGLCVTGKGEYDSNIFLKKIGNDFLITQIRFEAD